MKSDNHNTPLSFFDIPVTGALLATLAATVLAAPPAEAATRWQMTGKINYVHPTLAGTFARNETFTISMDLDESVATIPFEERRNFFKSGRTFSNAVSNGTATFPNYTVTFASTPDAGGTSGDGGISVENAPSTASGNFDQLGIDFTRQGGGIKTAPQVAGLDLNFFSFNFYGETAPLTMISGTDAGPPAIDAPFPGPGTFDLTKSDNPIYHLDVRFTGGNPEGSIFVRASIDTLTFSEIGGGGGGFADWPELATAPADKRGPNDTPAGDGVANIIKYALGIAPLESANARLPSKVVEGQDGDAGFPIVSFIRVKGLTGAPVEVEVSADLDYSTGLGSTVINTEDLGDGTERVTVRSNATFSSQTKQFFRLKVTLE